MLTKTRKAKAARAYIDPFTQAEIRRLLATSRDLEVGEMRAA